MSVVLVWDTAGGCGGPKSVLDHFGLRFVAESSSFSFSRLACRRHGLFRSMM